MKHMNLKKLAGLTAAAALTLAPLASLADTAQSALVKGGALNLRETASLSAKVLGQYPTGTLVEIIESGDEWHKVTVNGKTGYMMAKYLKVTDEVTSGTATVYNPNGNSYVNFRSAASLNASVLSRVPVGTQIPVLSKGTDWTKTQIDGVTGYISTWFLKF